MRIILIDAVDDSYGLQTKYHPLGLSYLVAYLPKAIKEKFEIKIINQDYFREIDDFKPQIVGISSVTQNFNKAKQIAAHAKKSGSFVLVGKSHITALPESLDDNMDVGIMGEGEETFLELLQLYLRGKTGPSDLNDIQGIVYRDTGRLAITRPRPFIANLDTIPFPDRSLFSLKPNDDFYMFTSRGCPYKCKFCFSSRFWHTTRFHSAEYVLEEIQEIYDKYRPLRITFSDDLFIADRKRLEEINERIKKRNYYRKIKFTISVRSNLVNDKPENLIKGIAVVIVIMA